MALVDLWNSDRSQITTKRLQQLMTFAGEGKLRDSNDTSTELRHLLSVVSSDLIGEWIDECLTDRFTDFGFVLQDIINEIGRRLGFTVKPGVYRGRSGKGYDGLWTLPGTCAILIESKSSTAYSINLSTIAEYRNQVNSDLEVPPQAISILIVVGRDGTDDLEAQVRGSRYAWDIRLLGVDSLFRLLRLKETLDDPNVERQIKEMLVPQEFTRLDRIVDLVFETAEDAQSAEEKQEETQPAEDLGGRTAPARFHDEVLPKLEGHFSTSLVKQARVLWASPDGKLLLSCQVSKEHQRADMHYWFGLKRTTKERLEEHSNGHCAFGLGDAKRVVLIRYDELAPLLSHCGTSPESDGRVRHWHIKFLNREDRVELVLLPSRENLDVTHLLVARRP